jgi:hypothetical protein
LSMEQKRGRGRPPREDDKYIEEIRRLHLEENVSLQELSKRTGYTVSHISKLVRGDRRAKAPGAIRGKIETTPANKTPKETEDRVMDLHWQGHKERAIVRKTGIPYSTVRGIVRRRRNGGG